MKLVFELLRESLQIVLPVKTPMSLHYHIKYAVSGK